MGRDAAAAELGQGARPQPLLALPPMDTLSIRGRRELLKMGSAMGLVGVAATGFASTTATGGSNAQAFFDVRTFGATGNGKVLDTLAVNQAIEAAAAAGGGTVVFPAGTYLCFSIHLRSRVHLYLSQGAILMAADSPKPGEASGFNGGTYDAAESNAPWEALQDFGHNHWHNSLLWGEDLADLSITGPGLIHGRGLSHGRDSQTLGIPFKAEQAGVGNKAVALKNCRNVLLRDFRILKGGHFGLLLTGVDNLTIDNLLIDTDRDGMDLDCCRNVRVSNCTVNSPWDDGICPKSSFALGFARATDTLTITNCFVTGTYELGSVLDGSFRKFAGSAAWRTGRIKCGTESNGGFRNITISNCVFEGCQGLALESVDGALIEDVAIANITMRDVVSAPLFFRLGARLRGPKETTKIGTLRRVSVTNLTSSNAGAPISSIISGIPNGVIEDLHLANLYLHHAGGISGETVNLEPAELEAAYPEPNMFGPTASQGLFLRHARRVELSHVEVACDVADPRPALVLSHVDRVDVFALTASAKPAIGLRKVTDLRVMLSRAVKDTTLASAERETL